MTELNKKEKEVLEKCKTPQILSDEYEFTIRGIQSSERFFLTGFDYDDMVKRVVITEEGRKILKAGCYLVISI